MKHCIHIHYADPKKSVHYTDGLTTNACKPERSVRASEQLNVWHSTIAAVTSVTQKYLLICASYVGLCESSFLLLEYSIEYLIEYSMDTGSSY